MPNRPAAYRVAPCSAHAGELEFVLNLLHAEGYLPVQYLQRQNGEVWVVAVHREATTEDAGREQL